MQEFGVAVECFQKWIGSALKERRGKQQAVLKPAVGKDECDFFLKNTRCCFKCEHNVEARLEPGQVRSHSSLEHADTLTRKVMSCDLDYAHQ